MRPVTAILLILLLYIQIVMMHVTKEDVMDCHWMEYS